MAEFDISSAKPIDKDSSSTNKATFDPSSAAIFYPGAEKSAREIKKTYEQPDYPIEQAEPKEFSKGEVAASGAIGGVTSAVAPKVLQKGGQALEKKAGQLALKNLPGVLEKLPGPMGRVGTAMDITGRVLANTPLVSRVLGGTTLGATSDIAGQFAEQAGFGGPGRFFTEMAVGTVPSLTKPFVQFIFSRTGRTIGGVDAVGAMNKAAKEIQSLSNNDLKTLNSMAKALGGGKYEQGSMELIYALVGKEGLAEARATEEAIDRILTNAKTQADAIKDADAAQASRILNLAQRKAAEIKQSSETRLQNNLLLKLEQQRKSTTGIEIAKNRLSEIVAPPKELSDIGNELRDSISNLQKDRVVLRQTVRDQEIAMRDAEIQNKVAKNDLISNTNDIREIVSDLKKLVLREYEAIPVEAPITAKAQVDQVNGLLQSLQGVPVRIQNNRVSLPANINPANSGYIKDYIQKLSQLGNLEGRTVVVPPSFEAIDQIRRSLGEAFKGKPPVGYESINKEFAKDLYVKLSKAMGKYSEQHRRFIESYEALSRDLDIFRTKGAKKALALDDYLENNFATDPQGLAKYYFSSQQKVRDLLELTENKPLVEKTALEYVAGELKGKDSRAVVDYLTKRENSDWLRELPQVRKKLERYADQLAAAEARAGKAQSIVKRVEQLEPEIKKTSKERQDELLSLAGVKAGELEAAGKEKIKGVETAAAEQVAPLKERAAEIQRLIDQKKSPVDSFANYLLDENAVGNIKKISQYVAQSEGGEEAFKQAVISTMSRVSPNNLAKIYRERIRYALEGSGLYTPEQLLELDRKVAAAREPRFLENIIRGWLTSVVSSETPSRARNVKKFRSFSNPYNLGVSDYMGIF
jgi:hypothetical protein